MEGTPRPKPHRSSSLQHDTVISLPSLFHVYKQTIAHILRSRRSLGTRFRTVLFLVFVHGNPVFIRESKRRSRALGNSVIVELR
ncbi:hypothetical protein BCR34DRAFT_179333 [Clohesyomyces aquaticus]|uniref:Uncharacterized protein n=1 Tax=Clohesyomyces aquaticus TaxID=1231657 RepID=A0A1Y1YFY9_9PLEO|nr:hypothetical protein BCR34DRAFT_179333 [Clohesyomyces aquaticus]